LRRGYRSGASNDVNETTSKLNNIVLRKMPGDEHVLYSSDEGIAGENGHFDVLVEFLNTLAQGLPPHELRVKTGAPIIMLRNLYPAYGVCSNTRLIVETEINSRLLQTVIAKLDRVVFYPAHRL
jgi:ATP-dependent DNA helicase PIF1